MVLPMALRPRKISPITTSRVLMANIMLPTLAPGRISARMMDRPVVPPMAKWLGDLKKCVPAAVSSSPRFSRANQRRLPGENACRNWAATSTRGVCPACSFSSIMMLRLLYRVLLKLSFRVTIRFQTPSLRLSGVK